ncbi:hypothetical protein KUCAC02_001321 [Chaenocephalus aceratus]|uniref:Uncharacterized protein n=1 Tax=Chaenocephalus aceratus TaxID=36190 RepID=A0ACB9XVU6_CHAAC|nr:hypothetical protein KUCAC02_001321 [Chaenocephalus aceratus]
MKKNEIFDTISFTPFGTLACPSTPSPCSIHSSDDFNPPSPPLCASCRLYHCHLKKIK